MSGSPLGFVLPAASLGLGALLIRPRRGFFPLNSNQNSQPLIEVAQATVEEHHHDELELTEHPVERLAPITDHAFKRPTRVTIRCGWSNSPSKSGGLFGTAVGIASALTAPVGPLVAAIPSTVNAVQSILQGNSQAQVKAIYSALVRLQELRTLIDVYTGKRSYTNMLLKSITAETDEKTENVLMVTVVCQQVIIAVTKVTVVSGDSSVMKFPGETGAVSDMGEKSLQSSATFTADPITLSGSMSELQGGMDQISTLVASAPDELTKFSGQLSQVGEVATNLSASITPILAELPGTLTLPIDPGVMQTFSTEMSEGAAGFTAGMQDSLSSMKDQITSAQTTVSGAVDQFRQVQSQLPEAFSQLGGMMEAAGPQLQNALNQITRVLPGG